MGGQNFSGGLYFDDIHVSIRVGIHIDESQKVVLQVFLFNMEHRRCVSGLDQLCGNFVWVFKGVFIHHLNDVVGHQFGRKPYADQGCLRRCTIRV